MLQGALLPRRVEHAAEPVHHELQPQEEGQPGQDQGRRPQIAPEPPVEQSRGDEAPGQAGIVEAFHPHQPRSILTRRRVDGGVGVRTQGPGADQDGAPPAPGHAVQVRTGGERDAEPLQRMGEVVGLPCRVDDHHHLGVGAGGEGGEGGREVLVRAQGLGRAGLPRAAADNQLAAEHHDARPLPVGQLLGDVAARGQGAGGGGMGEEEVAQHHDPAAEGHVDPPHLARARGPRPVLPQLLRFGGHAAPMVSPKKGRAPPS